MYALSFDFQNIKDATTGRNASRIFEIINSYKLETLLSALPRIVHLVGKFMNEAAFCYDAQILR